MEDSISSYQKLYDKAIDYIGKNWDSLYQELLNWNYEYGNDTSDAITEAWENALAAAQRYGSYVNALNSIGGDIESSQSGGGNTVVGDTGKYPGASNTDIVHALVSQMKSYASQWGSSANPEALQQKAAAVEKQLHQYGVEGKIQLRFRNMGDHEGHKQPVQCRKAPVQRLPYRRYCRGWGHQSQ